MVLSQQQKAEAGRDALFLGHSGGRRMERPPHTSIHPSIHLSPVIPALLEGEVWETSARVGTQTDGRYSVGFPPWLQFS